MPEMVAQVSEESLFTKTTEETMGSGSGRAKPPDDIPEPPVPADVLEAIQAPGRPALPPDFGAHEALLQGFFLHFQQRLHGWLEQEHRAIQSLLQANDLDHQRLCESLKNVTQMTQQVISQVHQSNEHASYQLSDALLKLQEQGMKLLSAPYCATVEARSPQGFAVRLDLKKQESAELVSALPALLDWLTGQGYTPNV